MRGPLGSKKNLVKLVLIIWIGLLGLGFASFAGRWFAGITQSQETNEVFNEAAQLPAGLVHAVRWSPDPDTLARPMEPLTRVDLNSAWIRAWEQLSIVAQTGGTEGIEGYFSSSAGETLLANADAVSGRPVHQIAHDLALNFYSFDGKIIGLTADKVEVIRSIPIGDRLGWAHSVESYDAVLILQDGNWRVQHWVRRSVDQTWWSDPIAPSQRAAPTALNGINYYPRDTPFTEFWPSYDADVVAADLARIGDLGLDSVRIFLPFDHFGGNWTTEEDLAPVIDFMDRAAEAQIGVIVTLFDGRTDHRTNQWNWDRQHLTAVVEALAGHEALLMWDLKNEPDRDIGKNGVDADLLYAWLSFVGHALRDLDPETPTTVGWTTAQAALSAPVITEAVTFHHYTPADELYVVGPALMEHVDGRPIYITEYGLPTWNSIFPGGHTEAEQTVYLADIALAAQEVGIQGLLPWTLWDFAIAPPDAGSFPWSTGPQMTLGLLDAEGNPKPAAAIVSGDLAPENAPKLGIANRLQKRFWQAAIVGLIALVGLKLLRRAIDRKGSRVKTKPRQRRTAAEASPRP